MYSKVQISHGKGLKPNNFVLTLSELLCGSRLGWLVHMSAHCNRNAPSGDKTKESIPNDGEYSIAFKLHSLQVPTGKNYGLGTDSIIHSGTHYYVKGTVSRLLPKFCSSDTLDGAVCKTPAFG